MKISAFPGLSEEGQVKDCSFSMLQHKTVHDMCYRMYAAWMYLSCLFSFWRIKRKNRTREKQQHIYSTTNQPGTGSSFFWLAKTYYACWLSLKNGKGKLKKENSTQHVNYCTRERLEVLRQCKSIAPIQIMHSMGNGNGVCWCRAHGLELPPGWRKWSVGVGANLQGAGNKQGTNGGHSCRERSHSSAFYSDFISVLKGRSLCHFFMCFSKVL